MTSYAVLIGAASGLRVVPLTTMKCAMDTITAAERHDISAFWQMAKIAISRKLELEGPAGRLEGLIEAHDESGIVASAVVCHPHPLHGGTLHNKVTHTLARSFVSQHFAALRFNFRGVNESEGKFDDGRGELEDVLAAVAYLATQYPKLPLWLGGFSFGAAMAILAAAKSEPAGLISIAPATSRMRQSRQPQCPWLILQGDRDELVGVDDTIAWVNELEPGPELQILEGAEHFFHGRLGELREALESFISRHVAT